MGINPTTSAKDGIFIIEHDDLFNCLDLVTIAHYKGSRYKESWYDVEHDDGS
jgi:hypothetical protein